jgi:hypothetical protein
LAILHYNNNKQLYTKNCENKAKVNSHCEGMCQLKKKLQKTTTNKTEERRLEVSPSVYLPFLAIADFTWPKAVSFSKLAPQLGHYIGGLTSSLIIDYWQPPRSII